MYKVGVMLMGKPGTSPSKVKQVILEVQAKTKLTNILQYMLQIQKIKDMNYLISIEKSGDPVSQQSTIAQILRHTKPINNVIRLFLYESTTQQVNLSSQKIVFKPTSQQVYAEQLIKQKNDKKKQIQVSKVKQEKKKQKEEQVKGCCCC